MFEGLSRGNRVALGLVMSAAWVASLDRRSCHLHTRYSTQTMEDFIKSGSIWIVWMVKNGLSIRQNWAMVLDTIFLIAVRRERWSDRSGKRRSDRSRWRSDDRSCDDCVPRFLVARMTLVQWFIGFMGLINDGVKTTDTIRWVTMGVASKIETAEKPCNNGFIRPKHHHVQLRKHLTANTQIERNENQTLKGKSSVFRYMMYLHDSMVLRLYCVINKISYLVLLHKFSDGRIYQNQVPLCFKRYVLR